MTAAKKSATKKSAPKPSTMPKKLKTLTSRFIDFDDVTAQAWLDHDKEVRAKLKKDNRPLTMSNVKVKAQCMFEDAYMTTSQGPTVDSETAVLDGQHTLHGIVLYYEMCRKEGFKPTPVKLYVTEGETPDNFMFYDLGKPRTSADVFAIEKVQDPKEYSYAARLLWIRCNGKKVAGAGKLSPYALHEFVKDHKGLADSLKFIMSFGQSEESLPCKEIMSPGYAAALHYLMVHADDVKDASSKADEFWTMVIEQESKKGTAPYFLTRKILKVKATKDLKMSRDALVDYTILAFNNWIDGETKRLQLPKDGRPELGGYDGSLVEYEEELEEELEAVEAE